MKLHHLSAVTAAMLIALTGCTAGTSPRPAASSAPSASASAPAEPETAPELVLDGTAEQNRPYFDYVVTQHIEEDGEMGTAALGQLLTAAGWSADVIEVTPDVTPLGNSADAISFAVAAGTECLVGQWNGEYTSAIAPRLSSGTCLVGTPRPVG